MEYHAFMNHCRQLGRQAAGRGNPPVGAVVVRGGQIIGEGEEAGRSEGDVTCHAEIEAIRDAVRRGGSADLSDCTLVTTHEPCVMCAYVIRYHQIARVVCGQTSPEVGGVTSLFPVLTTAAFWPKKPAPEVVWWTGDGVEPLP